MAELQVVPVQDVAPGDVLRVMNAAFGRSRSPDWYRWKHLDGPWGPSRGWVAVGPAGPVGVRLFLPWRVVLDDRSYDLARAVDGAVLPEHRRQGVFRALVQAEMTSLQTAPTWSGLLSTAVPASRAAYESLGWTVLVRTRTVSRPFLPAPPARVRPGLVAADHLVPVDGRIQTDWSTPALSWRADPRSGQRCTAVHVADDDRSGLLYAVVGAGRLRRLSVLAAWGPRRRTAVTAAATVERCVAVLEPAGPGTVGLLHGPGLVRAGSTVCLWTTPGRGPHAPALDPLSPGSWALQGVDLQGAL